MKSWNKSCFLQKPLRIIKFTAELEYKLVTFNNAKKKFITKFPLMKNVKTEANLKKLKMTKIGLYSGALIEIGETFYKILKEFYGTDGLKKMVITDGNGGVGGMSIHLVEKCKFLNIIELNPHHVVVIKHNLDTYGFNHKKYKIYNDDSMEKMFELDQDIIILDPPWGGKDYSGKKSIKLGFNNVNIVCILNKLIKENKFKCCLLLVPWNFNFNNFMSKVKSKSITIYHIYGLEKKNSYVISIINDNKPKTSNNRRKLQKVKSIKNNTNKSVKKKKNNYKK